VPITVRSYSDRLNAKMPSRTVGGAPGGGSRRGAELPWSWCPSHASFQARRVQDIQRKFAHEIVASADSRLRQHAVCTASPYIVLSRQPRVAEQAGREGAGIHRDLWSEFTLTSVIGYIGVFNSKARSGAKAKGWRKVYAEGQMRWRGRRFIRRDSEPTVVAQTKFRVSLP
jgi:hypothetical protein